MAKDKKLISRRDFIKGAAAGVVSMAALSVVDIAANLSKGEKGGSAGAAATGEAGGQTAQGTGLKYTPGTYSATAKGISSDVSVTMTFSEDAITDVQIDVSGETAGIGADIGPAMQEAIMSAQTANVDAVASATVTSDAIKKAAADCISQASGQEFTLAAEEEAAGDWLGTAPEIADADIKETVDTDVLVVGLGTGGWITTMTAAETDRRRDRRQGHRHREERRAHHHP